MLSHDGDLPIYIYIYDMVERVLEQMEAIRNVLSDDHGVSHLMPSWQDNDVLQSIATALKPLKAMTDALSSASLYQQLSQY